MVVVDASALLAVFFEEEHAQWVVERLTEHVAELRMSTVNLAETLIRVRDRQPQLYDAIESRLLTGGIRFVSPDVEQARIAAEARLRLPLNLGDCFVYALAKVEGCPILTVDSDFRSVDCSLVMPVLA